MTINTKPCSDLRLEVLLSESDSGDEYRVVAEHVGHCETCQRRLTELAADAVLWSDVKSLLSGQSEPRWEPDTSQSGVSLDDSPCGPAVVQEMVLRLLGTPNHPEMLGRLGRYDIERAIGSGGMGVVLKAHDSELNRPIAIKLLAPHLAHVGAARERFAREGRAAAAVVHEHVVAIYNVESGGPVPYLVMQYVPGRSLDARVTEDGPLEVEEILRIGIQAASGLAAAHRQGLVHRDVKPANILLENSVERAILTDFGLARAIDDASLTQTGILAGTPHYMSPEQAMGTAIDHRSDLFSLGAVLYFMATGHPPFRGSSALGVLHRICREDHRPVWQLNKDIPDELSEVIDRLLEKKPGRRYASAAALQEKLAGLLSRVQRQGLGRRRFRAWRGKRLRRKLPWLALAVAACAAVVGGVSWLANSPGQPISVEAVRTPEAVQAPPDESELKELDGEFFSDLGTTLSELHATTPQTHFLQGSEDPWLHELKMVERDLNRLESMTGKLPE